MPYTKQTWTDGVSTANAARLGHIENGVETAQAAAETAQSTATSAAASATTAQSTATAAAAAAAAAVQPTDSRLTDARPPTDGSVNDAKIAPSGISADKIVNGSTNGVLTLAEIAALLGLSGAVHITTTNGDVSAVPDDTLIARYAAQVPATPTVAPAGTNTTTSSGTTITATTTTDYAVGDLIVVAMDRGVASGTQTMATHAVTLATGAVAGWTRASANRSGVHDLALIVGLVTTAIPSGTTVTVTTSLNSTYRAAVILGKVTGCDSGTPNATTGDLSSGQLGNTTNGATASATSLTVTTPATTVPTIAFAAFAIGTGTFTFDGAWTQIAQAVTAAGSTDRGVALAYRVYTATATPQATITANPSSGMSAVALAVPLDMVDA